MNASLFSNDKQYIYINPLPQGLVNIFEEGVERFLRERLRRTGIKQYVLDMTGLLHINSQKLWLLA